VQAFNDAWSAAIAKLFGTQASPESGVLTQIAKAVGVASVNYAAAEDVVTKMFRDLASAVGNPSGDTGPGRDVTDGPIIEHTPS
jgi:hypothetical protein